MRSGAVLVAVGTLAVLALAPGPAGAQAPDLLRADSLVREGRAEAARGLLQRWWDARPAGGDRDIQLALWLRGRLTVDPVQASLSFQRLVVDHPGGAYSDRALLRLARAAEADGDAAAAEERYRMLVTDYPRTASALEARSWLGEHAAGRRPRAGGGVAAVRAEKGRSAAPSGFAIQAGAFADESRARTLAARLDAAGFEARVVGVPGSDLARVRIGRFEDFDGALAVLDRLRSAGFEAVVVADAAAERPLGQG